MMCWLRLEREKRRVCKLPTTTNSQKKKKSQSVDNSYKKIEWDEKDMEKKKEDEDGVVTYSYVWYDVI